MTKNIVLLSDGTGNSASSPHKTNVWRLYKAIDKAPTSIQVAFYDDGVGTSSFVVKKLLGQAFGWGLKRNVKELYQNLCRVYDDNDKIFIFGYSRGAYTARFLAGLIANQGIIRNFSDEIDLRRKVEEAYDSFRQETFVPSVLTVIPWVYRYFTKSSTPDATNPKERHIYDSKMGPLIEMLGVWDTVDAYGAPIDELTRGWDMVVWPLTAKDRNLSPAIGAAYHALALDEQREAFEPMLWNEDGDTYTQKKPSAQILEQVWFPGVHSNVGGGNPDDSLAYVSLNWMIRKAKNKHKLQVEPILEAQYNVAADVNGPLYNNRSGFGNVYRFAPRKVEILCKSEKPGIVNTFLKVINSPIAEANEVQIDCPKIHYSVFDRIRNGGDGYAPINLPQNYCVVTSDRRGNDKILKQPDKPRNDRLTETPNQARERRIIQSKVWNLVWLQKIFYFVFILSAIAFVIGPNAFLKESAGDITESADILFGSIGDLFRLIPQYIGKIPGLEPVGGWANKYNDHPYVFVFGIIFLFSLVITGVIVQGGRRSIMRKHWSHIWGQDEHVIGLPNKRNWLVNFLDSYRDSDAKENTVRISPADSASTLLRLAAEVASALLFLALVYLIGWKIFLTALDGTGNICEEPTSTKGETQDEILFDPTNPCVDTGFDLLEGKEYTIESRVPENWTDGTIEADAYGLLKPPPWAMNLMVPIRRHIGKDWYQPIGRVGHTYYDRYTVKLPENKVDLEHKDFLRKPEYCPSITFKARQPGRLYIYLNDAVAPWPFERWQFYQNNCESGKCLNDELAKLKISQGGNVSDKPLCKENEQRD